jgi:hypothetical protein
VPAALARDERLGFDVSVYDGGDFYGYASRGTVSLDLSRVENVDPKTTLVVSVHVYVSDADALHGMKQFRGRGLVPPADGYRLRATGRCLRRSRLDLGGLHDRRTIRALAIPNDAPDVSDHFDNPTANSIRHERPGNGDKPTLIVCTRLYLYAARGIEIRMPRSWLCRPRRGCGEKALRGAVLLGGWSA